MNQHQIQRTVWSLSLSGNNLTFATLWRVLKASFFTHNISMEREQSVDCLIVARQCVTFCVINLFSRSHLTLLLASVGFFVFFVFALLVFDFPFIPFTTVWTCYNHTKSLVTFCVGGKRQVILSFLHHSTTWYFVFCYFVTRLSTGSDKLRNPSNSHWLIEFFITSLYRCFFFHVESCPTADATPAFCMCHADLLQCKLMILAVSQQSCDVQSTSSFSVGKTSFFTHNYSSIVDGCSFNRLKVF